MDVCKRVYITCGKDRVGGWGGGRNNGSPSDVMVQCRRGDEPLQGLADIQLKRDYLVLVLQQ